MTTTLEAPPAPPRPALRRGRVVGAALLGAVDGPLGIALPFAVLAALGVLAWAGLGAPTDWTTWIRAAAVLQLLGHGVDVRFPGFTATVAVLGPALVTAAAAVRAGRRAAGTAAPLAAWAGVVAGTAAGAAGLLLVGTSPEARPVAWQAVVLPSALVAVVALAALRRTRSAAPLPPGVRAGLAGTGLLLAAAAAGTALLLLARFADVVALYEGLDAGPLGGLVLTAAQALALPTLVVWGAAWTTGAPIALGAGSATSAFATQVGPLPGLAVLGLVPADPGPVAAVALLLPVLAGFAAGVLARRSGVRTPSLTLGALAGLTAGAAMGLLALATAGAAGPGRFGVVGTDPLLAAGLAAVEIGLPAILGAAVVRAPEPPEPPEADQ
ncbi:DUF6350 family protein [Amnibacterium endophyticum]|uniref:DUF6350 family protein n=1 Tax=Amnibacterium endophyticum TaxID=2109337 RepID=A0ABW4LC25_9MICO